MINLFWNLAIIFAKDKRTMPPLCVDGYAKNLLLLVSTVLFVEKREFINPLAPNSFLPMLFLKKLDLLKKLYRSWQIYTVILLA